MKLAMLGGGGFRTPLVYAALLADRAGGVTEVVLQDPDRTHLEAIGHVLDQTRAGVLDAPRVSVTTELDRALDGADFVFSAVRVGGLEARVADEFGDPLQRSPQRSGSKVSSISKVAQNLSERRGGV